MIDTAKRLEMYRWMALTRRFDETMVAMWRSGRGLGGTYSQKGHEAIGVGVGLALGADDVVAPMHRDLGTYLVRGMTPERIFGNLLGRVTGPTRGRDANFHGMGDLSLGILGYISHLPNSLATALGAAMAFRYREEPRVALTFCGDGGATAGTYHETLNMAALWKAPFVMVVESNQYAYSTPSSEALAVSDIASHAEEYGIRGMRIDGNDVEAVYEATVEALDRSRKGGAPTVIVALTMRMAGHAIHDGAEYVSPELLEEWARRDPLVRLGQRLTQRNEASEEDLEEMNRWAKERIVEAVRNAEAAAFPDPNTVEEHVWA